VTKTHLARFPIQLSTKFSHRKGFLQPESRIRGDIRGELKFRLFKRKVLYELVLAD